LLILVQNDYKTFTLQQINKAGEKLNKPST